MATVIQLLKWSEESGLTAAIGGLSDSQASNIITNWYSAIKSTRWAGQTPATMWTGSRRPVGLLATPFVTESLMKILLVCLSKLGEAGITGVPTLAQFSQITEYLKQLGRENHPARWVCGGEGKRSKSIDVLTDDAHQRHEMGYRFYSLGEFGSSWRFNDEC